MFNLVGGYTGYYILGYYLNKVEIGRMWRKVIYAMVIVGLIFIPIGTYFLTKKIMVI